MALFNSFQFGDVDSKDYGVYISGDSVYDSPARSVDLVQVPGRNGALALDNGYYENIEVTYPAGSFGTSQEEWREKMLGIRNALAAQKGYQKLIDTYHPEHYRLGMFFAGISASPVQYNRAGQFPIRFNCKPQRYLNLGEVPTEIDANPSETYEGALVTFTAAEHDTISDMTVQVTPVQIGNGLDPSPTNVRAILGFDKAHILNSKFAVSASNGRLVIPWKDGNTNYNPEMNLCSVSDEELEGGTSVHGTFFEWDKTMPFGVPFDPPEAIYYFDGTEGAGTFHISIGMAYGDGWKTTKHIQFTLNVAPAEGDQLFINCGTNAANDPTNGRAWNLYAKGSTTSKDSGTTSDGTGGTNLGSTDSTDVGKTNGRVNAPQRIVYGYNRWSQSFLRQYLNATTESGWYAAANPWDRPDATVMAKAGFLYGYGAEVYSYFKPIKVVTVACNADSNVEDVTYDRVFLSSLEQMYCVPQFSGKEGSYWEYYKRLLGRTSPAPTSATYARLIKYALNAPTSAQNCWRRSANRYGAANAWIVYASGSVYANCASNAFSCAPSVFISDEDMSVKTIDFGQTVYGGTLNVTTGVLTVTHANIASYEGETLPSTWICDRAVYAEGVTPPTGSQVVYELATPIVYTDLTPQQITTLLGSNNVFADTGDISVTITEPTYFVNPTNFPAKPLIRVYGNGSVQVGDTIATVQNNADGYVDIDCESMNCYDTTGGRNADVSFSGNDFPELASGNNGILLTGPSKVEITPRWWEL